MGMKFLQDWDWERKYLICCRETEKTSKLVRMVVKMRSVNCWGKKEGFALDLRWIAEIVGFGVWKFYFQPKILYWREKNLISLLFCFSLFLECIVILSLFHDIIMVIINSLLFIMLLLLFLVLSLIINIIIKYILLY